MSTFALQSPAGGFLDEDMDYFNKRFDDWCVQFDNYEDASLIADSFDERKSVEIELHPWGVKSRQFTLNNVKTSNTLCKVNLSSKTDFLSNYKYVISSIYCKLFYNVEKIKMCSNKGS